MSEQQSRDKRLSRRVKSRRVADAPGQYTVGIKRSQSNQKVAEQSEYLKAIITWIIAPNPLPQN